jgi:hypothetical protein
MNRSINRLLTTGLGAEKTIGTDVYDYYMEGRNVLLHGPVDIQSLVDFTKKKPFSMFDKLLKDTEKVGDFATTKTGRSFINLFHVTKIFNFENLIGYNTKTAQEDAKAFGDRITKNFLEQPLDDNMLGLPFHNTTIVTPDSATMFQAIEGIGHAYMFISIINVANDPVESVHWFISGLVMRPNELTRINDLRIAVHRFSISMGNLKYQNVLPRVQTPENASAIALPVIGKALSLIMTLNTPDRFIMEVSPVKTDVRSPKYIPKSHQRPEYIILHPHVIRHYMKTESDVEGHKRRGHERRGHLRRYPNDPIRFPKAHGKTIQILPLWIGRTEATVGDRHYKVIL